MRLTRLRVLLGAAAGFIAFSFLGGSAIWVALGFGDDLSVEGRAGKVYDGPLDVGAGWQVYGGDAGGHRYSAATQITPVNANRLEVAWTYRTGAFEGREEAGDRASFQTTPILVEGALIFCTQFNDVISIDPATGKENWRYDPDVPLDGRPANEFLCRGVSYWADAGVVSETACGSRVFMGTVDARLIALDARTGRPCADFGDAGAVRIESSLALRWPGEFQITSAPAIAGDIVVTGTSISDNLRSDAPLGTVHAFDVRTGEQIWKFNPIPWVEAPEGHKSGHANVWSTIAVDDERGVVFLPTSTASPDFFGGERPGDNAHANSVVALRAETGDLLWARQLVHHDVWDYDLPAQPGLYEIRRADGVHDVVVQVTKMGLIFVLDRDTGEPFHPIEERSVPQNGAEGEMLSATQPFPVRPPAIVPDRLGPGAAFGITLWDKMACQARLQRLRQDGLYTPPSEEGTLVYPFTGGGANWGGGAFDPSRNLLVINMNSAGQSITLHRDVDDEKNLDGLYHGAEFAPMEGAPYAMTRELVDSPVGLPCTPPPWGVLAGVDLDKGEIVWRRPFGTTRDLAPGGLSLAFGTPSFGGPIITAGGVVFIGAAMDNYLRAFSVETGEEVWKGRLPAGGQATPMTYEYGGRQFVVIAAGGHGKSGTKQGDFVVAFAIPE